MIKLKVTMNVIVKDEKDVDVIKVWEHHIDRAIDMDSYPEIEHIEGVKVDNSEEMENEELINMIDSLDFSQRDTIYRHLWTEYVEKDVRARAEERKIKLSEDQIGYVKDRYVYNGDYDCNLSYWNNIDNLIDEIIPQKQHTKELVDCVKTTIDNSNEKLNAKWYFIDVEIENFVNGMNGDLKNGPIDFGLGYMGSFRTGDLCFDIIMREYDSIEYRIDADLYVGGEDTGYDYGKNNYPYDYFDACGWSWKVEEFQDKTVDEFKKIVCKKCEELILEFNNKCPETYSETLIEKANKPFNIW